MHRTTRDNRLQNRLKILFLHILALILVPVAYPVAAAEDIIVADTAQISITGIPASWWIVLFVIATSLYLISIFIDSQSMITSVLAFILSGALVYLLPLARDIRLMLVPVVDATGNITGYTLQPATLSWQIPGLGYLAFLLMALSVISMYSAYLHLREER
ncbi:MAG: hypothetical protein JRD89_09845 [Deltaproteobacteria bacterium]|nr:hypothetical protein [Deltaproteobacteria bacterium]